MILTEEEITRAKQLLSSIQNHSGRIPLPPLRKDDANLVVSYLMSIGLSVSQYFKQNGKDIYK